MSEPKHPIEDGKFPFKTFLYLFDNDQIYDLLMFDRIDSRILSALSQAFGDHACFVNNMVGLYQRYAVVPADWCSEWTTKVYKFLVPLTRTWILTDGLLNGSYYGFNPLYKMGSIDSFGFGDFPKTLKLKVPQGKTVQVSWMAWTYSEKVVDLDTLVGGYITDWSRYSQVFNATNGDLEVELDCSHWLFCSCVINGNGQFIGLSDTEKQLVSYNSLDSVLNKINSVLNLPTCQVLMGFDYEQTLSKRKYSTWFSVPFDEPYKYTNPSFASVPDWYFYASLIYGRDLVQTFGFEGIVPDVKTDLGKRISVVKYDSNGKEVTGTADFSFYGLKVWYRGPMEKLDELSFTIDSPIPFVDQSMVPNSYGGMSWDRSKPPRVVSPPMRTIGGTSGDNFGRFTPVNNFPWIEPNLFYMTKTYYIGGHSAISWLKRYPDVPKSRPGNPAPGENNYTVTYWEFDYSQPPYYVPFTTGTYAAGGVLEYLALMSQSVVVTFDNTSTGFEGRIITGSLDINNNQYRAVNQTEVLESFPMASRYLTLFRGSMDTSLWTNEPFPMKFPGLTRTFSFDVGLTGTKETAQNKILDNLKKLEDDRIELDNKMEFIYVG